MFSTRSLVRSTCVAAMVAAGSLSLATSATADASPVAAVALVGRNAPQVEAGASLSGAASKLTTEASVIPQIERTDGSGRSSYAFSDADGALAAPPTAVALPHIDTTLIAVGMLPAVAPEPVPSSALSTIVLLVGFALFAFGLVATGAGTWHRLAPALRTATTRSPRRLVVNVSALAAA